MAPSNDVRAETETMLVAAGIRVSDEGRSRVRDQLAALDAHWTPERRERATRDFLARIESA
jgi:hypothetical protein